MQCSKMIFTFIHFAIIGTTKKYFLEFSQKLIYFTLTIKGNVNLSYNMGKVRQLYKVSKNKIKKYFVIAILRLNSSLGIT